MQVEFTIQADGTLIDDEIDDEPAALFKEHD